MNWRDELHERYAPGTDSLYEEELRACREQGHVQTIEVCPRCGEDLGTLEEETPR